MKKTILLWVFLFSGIAMQAQYSPAYRRAVTITNTEAVSYTNYQVYIKMNTAALVAGGNMLANGDDIRFSSDSACSPTVFYDYYIENYMNTDSTMIWVKIPEFNAGVTYTLYMYYGDSAATTGSDFAATFPGAFISDTSLILSGNQVYDWFELSLDDTLYIVAGDSTLQINARNIVIRGNVNGQGRGFQIPVAFNLAGNGPGAGTPSSISNSGAGGAGYGGAGGIGCSDAGDSPGTGGLSYGTLSDPDIQMGSSGANSDNSYGGSGGGRLVLNAEVVQISGLIDMDGNNAQLPGGSRGGGGGAGGGLKVECSELRNSGTITANGGQGSDGTSSANDGGGGGAGGRIKLFYEINAGFISTLTVNGGVAGIYGGVPGGPGGPGTIYSGVLAYPNGPVSVGGEIPLGASSAFISPITCDSYTSPSGNYVWTVSGTYMDTILNAIGCDSVLTIDLTVNTPASGTDVQVSCGSYFWPLDGVTYFSTTNTPTFNIVGGAVNGCDSLVTLDLTINNPTTGTDIQTACGSYTWPLDGVTYFSTTNTPTFNIVGGAASGCDSLVTLDLTINNVSDLSTSVIGTTIQATNSNATYVWLDCDNNYSILPGETSQSFAPATNGNYAVELTENGCVDTSLCVFVSTVGILESNFDNQLLVYPNPTAGNFSIDLGSVYESVEISIVNVKGQLIYSKPIAQSQILNLSIEEPAGIYIISIQADDKKAVIRLVKE